MTFLTPNRCPNHSDLRGLNSWPRHAPCNNLNLFSSSTTLSKLDSIEFICKREVLHLLESVALCTPNSEVGTYLCYLPVTPPTRSVLNTPIVSTAIYTGRTGVDHQKLNEQDWTALKEKRSSAVGSSSQTASPSTKQTKCFTGQEQTQVITG